MEVTIPLGLKAKINGIDVEFTTDAVVDFKGAESVDHAAELLAGARLDIDLSHKEGDRLVTYGAAGKRFERAVEKPAPKAKAEKAEKPKAKPKG